MARRIALAAVVMLAAACAGDSTGPASAPSVDGIYQLQSVNGMPLPTVLTDGVATLTVTAGTLTLEANGRFTHVIEFDDAPGLAGGGTWLLGDDQMTLDYDQSDFGVEIATHAGDRITIEGSLELLYER